MRNGQDICWHCCNQNRIDRKCPSECRYSLLETDNFQIKTNADSIQEYNDLLKKQMEKWILTPQEIFNGNIPIEMSATEEGKKKIIDFLNQFQISSSVPLSYLKERLLLDDLKVDTQKDNYEDIAEKYLNKIIEQDWEGTISFLSGKSNKYKDNYIKRISSNKIIKMLTGHELISSAISQDKKQALVYFEVNSKYDITIVLKETEKNWKITAKFFGKPEIFNGENEANQQVAILLSKNELSKAFELLGKYSAIYVDSADLQYYLGLYYMFCKKEEKAEIHLLNSVEIDPDFVEAKGLYATVLLHKQQMEKAKSLYLEVIQANPKDIKSLNNLASIYIEEGDKDKARELLEKCLKIDPNFEYAKKNMEKII